MAVVPMTSPATAPDVVLVQMDHPGMTGEAVERASRAVHAFLAAANERDAA